MRVLAHVGRWVFALVLANATSAGALTPSYIKLGSGTLAAGGVEDLLGEGQALSLLPTGCQGNTAVVELGVGFVVDKAFDSLSVHGIIEASTGCTVEVLFKSSTNGRRKSFGRLSLADPSFAFKELPVDSATYRDRTTSEIELYIVVGCACHPPSTGEDAVSVQALTIGPTPN